MIRMILAWICLIVGFLKGVSYVLIAELLGLSEAGSPTEAFRGTYLLIVCAALLMLWVIADERRNERKAFKPRYLRYAVRRFWPRW